MPSTAKLLACLVLLLLATAASAKWVPPEFQPKATASVDATATKAAAATTGCTFCLFHSHSHFFLEGKLIFA